MQLRENRVLNESEIVGAQRSADFSIAATSKAFQILMDGIYSNKVGAAVREVMTNAWDAQVEAGNDDVAFQVHVPSRWEPNFFVRDFGVSMDEETVMGSEDGSKPGLYNSLFASTKNNSNDVAGAFGIGSKAPFAYIAEFQVTTWLDGVKTLYNCQMQTNGKPMVSKVGAAASDEPQGVMVGFPVKDEDVDAFRKEIRRMLLGFNVMPELLNVDLYHDTYFGPAATIAPSRTGGSWRLYGRDYNEAFDGSGLFARQGCVVYPIDLTKIEAEAASQGKSEVLSLFRSTRWSPSDTTAILDFTIGDLSVAASRETLAYDDETVRAIVGRLDGLADELVADAVTLIKAEPTPLRAAKAFDGLALGTSFKTLVGTRVKIDVPTVDRHTGQTEIKSVPVRDIVSRYKHGLRFNADQIQRDYGIVVSPVKHSSSRPSFRPAYQVVVDVWSGCRFVLETPGLDRATNRIVTFVEHVDDDKRQIWWVRPADQTMSRADLKAKLKSWLDGMEAGLDFDLLSDHAPANLGSGSQNVRGGYNAFRRVDLDGMDLVSVQHKPEDGGLYVLLKGGRVQWTVPEGGEVHIELYALGRLLESVRSLTGKDPLAGRQLIGIVGQSHGLVDKHAGWVDLQAELKALVAAEIDQKSLKASAKAWACDTMIDNRFTDKGRRMEGLIAKAREIADHLVGDHLIRDISDEHLAANQPTRYTQANIRSLTRWFSIDVPSYSTFKAKHILLAQQAMRCYPLLNGLDLSAVSVEEVAKYVNLVDEADKRAVDATRGDAA